MFKAISSPRPGAISFIRDRRFPPMVSQNLLPVGFHRTIRVERSWSIVLTGLLFAFVAFSAEFVCADAGDDQYKVSAALHDKERWSDAVDQFRVFFKEYPGHPRTPEAQFFMGDSLIKLQKYEEAREFLRRFVKENPKNRLVGNGVYLIGESSFLLRDLEAAEQELTAYLTSYPDGEFIELALLNLGDTQLRLKQPENAAGNYQKALDRFPQGKHVDEARYGIAQAYEDLKKGSEAEAIYRALAAKAESALADDSQSRLALLLFADKKYAESAAAYDELASRFPESPLATEAALSAGSAYYRAGDYATAIVRYEKAAEYPEQLVTARLGKGLSQKSLKQYADAATTFQQTYAAHPDDPVAERLLYYWADAEFNQGQWEPAKTHFLDVVKRWPEGQFADFSLYNAAEAALFSGQLDESQQLIDRFAAEYSKSGLRLLVELLRGRLQVERGGEEQLKQALVHFNNVLTESTIARTQMLARRHLAATYLKMGDNASVVTILEPVVADIKQQGASSEFTDVLVILAESLLREKKYTEAIESASDYLKFVPEGSQAESAIAIKAIGNTHLGDENAAQHNLTILFNKYPDSPTLAQTAFMMANINYEAQKWDQSAKLYATIGKFGSDSPYHAQSLSGEAWCLYHQKKFEPAAALFADFIKQHADDKSAAEAAFMQGRCLESAERLGDAIAAYAVALDKYQPAREAYLSGLQIARLHGQQGEIDKSDEAYENLLKVFPKPERLDQLLEEWAMLNYEAERFQKSDDIFRRLIAETPDSELVDNARLSLAESDLVAGKLPEARKVFQELEASQASDADVQEISLYRLIGITIDLEEWDEAAKWSLQLETRFPDSEFVWFSRFQKAEALFHQGKLDEAFAALNLLKAEKKNEAVAKASWFPRVFILLGEIHLRRKEYSDVFAIVDELKGWDSDSPFLYQAYEIQGRANKNQAKFKEAIESFKKVIDDPEGRSTETAAKSQFMIAEIYVLQKDFQSAKLEYLKVDILYAFPQWQAPALYQAAICHESLKEIDLAKKTYAELVRKFPDNEYAPKATTRLKELGK
ncbi:MAG: tetratricopeptide repeat protein [Planctomycetota bacterium]|nr:tetratricopeptide repeat protein [Planctomycetota bacterium]MDA1211448.1 tetratricopeptide repeat protein [Planctomycetota bacterium]